jgi:biotin carboxyl carrier protein
VPQIEIKAEVTGSVWKIVTQVGQTLDAGDTIMILESMKMEIPVMTEDGGKLVELKVQEGVSVAEGQVVAVVQE